MCQAVVSLWPIYRGELAIVVPSLLKLFHRVLSLWMVKLEKLRAYFFQTHRSNIAPRA